MAETKRDSRTELVTEDGTNLDDFFKQMAPLARRYIDNQPQIAQINADAGIRIAAEHAKTKRTTMMMLTVLGGIAIVGLCVLITVAINKNKDDLAKELLITCIPPVITGVGGWIGGRGSAKTKKEGE